MLITDQAAIMNTPIDSSHKNLHLGLLFHLANQFKDLLIGHYFADSGITAPQFKVLINIFKGNTSPAEICKSLQMRWSPSATKNRRTAAIPYRCV